MQDYFSEDLEKRNSLCTSYSILQLSYCTSSLLSRERFTAFLVYRICEQYIVVLYF